MKKIINKEKFRTLRKDFKVKSNLTYYDKTLNEIYIYKVYNLKKKCNNEN